MAIKTTVGKLLPRSVTDAMEAMVSPAAQRAGNSKPLRAATSAFHDDVTASFNDVNSTGGARIGIIPRVGVSSMSFAVIGSSSLLPADGDLARCRSPCAATNLNGAG